MQEASKRILDIISRIPEGRVCSYGDVAGYAGIPRGARTVARLLHACSANAGLPWQRVVRADGGIALPEGGGFEEQKALLELEGVAVDGRGRVDLYKHRWKPGSSRA